MPALTRPVLPPLQTPKTASFPSQVTDSPLGCVSALIKQEDGTTPITPPVAYTDFLKALNPVLASPPASGALQRSLSGESTSTRNSVTSIGSTSTSFNSSFGRSDYKSPADAVSTPTASRKGPTALRRLRIPHSPAFSPTTTTCGPSPRTAVSGLSTGGLLYSPFSPAEWTVDSAGRRFSDAPRSACSKPVTVRSVVTRTVTYKRSPPLDPPPRGKRRKIDPAAMLPPGVAKEANAAAAAAAGARFPSNLVDESRSMTNSPVALTPPPAETVPAPPEAAA